MQHAGWPLWFMRSCLVGLPVLSGACGGGASGDDSGGAPLGGGGMVQGGSGAGGLSLGGSASGGAETGGTPTGGTSAYEICGPGVPVQPLGATCRYVIPIPPPPFVLVDTMTPRVFLTTGSVRTELTHSTSADCANGGDWHYSAWDQAIGYPTEIEFCPEACARVAVDPSATIVIALDCPAPV